MRAPALAIGWEFRRRHRWGLIAVAGYLFVVATIRFLILEPGEPVLVDSVRFAALVSVPLTTTFVYLLAVFSFGFAGDLAARHSMYPARMFTLPVTNAALVGWPMLYGTAAVAVLLLAPRLFAVWPSGIEIPLIWPALLAAALLAWTQALTWMPYRSEEHTSELQSLAYLVCRLLLEKKKSHITLRVLHCRPRLNCTRRSSS